MTVDPYGVDIAPELVDRARADHPDLATHFWVGDALDWVHPEGERFDLVHVLLDVIPPERHHELLQHQLDHVVAPGGRLLASEYGDPPTLAVGGVPGGPRRLRRWPAAAPSPSATVASAASRASGSTRGSQP